MKISSFFAAAGLMVATLGFSTAAEAQQYRGDRYEQQYRGDRDDRYDRDRRDYRDNDRRYDRRNWDGRRDNGRHYGWRNGRGHQSRCWIEWRRHRQVRVCG